VTTIDVQGGTDDSLWRDWLAGTTVAPLDLSPWQDRRVVVLNAHPDDAVLAVGGTLALLAARGVSLAFAWATFGEGSHPDSTSPVVKDLAWLRVLEEHAALSRLGVAGQTTWFGLPDGGLDEKYGDLLRAVRELYRPGDVWLAPFRGDLHPDHEACWRAASEVSPDVVEMPIWAWHATTPEDNSLPWSRARAMALPPDVVARKAAAIDEFHTQVRPIGPDPQDAAVLPPRVIEHFLRDAEVVLT
jgi:LmbE family N-acetylglucosaminyl deacetylase